MPTSRYDSSVKVKQEVIDRIKKMGMSGAIGAANSGKESAEFVEGAKRMYGNRVGAQNSANLSKAQNVAATNPNARRAPTIDGGSTGGGGGEKKSTSMPPSAPAAASRRTTKTGPEKVLGKANAKKLEPVGKSVSNISTAIAGQRAMNVDSVSKALSGAGKKLGLNNPFKPRKRK